MENKSKLVSGFIIVTFVTLYLMVSIISTIHVVDFFKLSNPEWLAISLAIAFEVGAAASLASLIALKKMNKGLVWMLFFLLTAMQAMGNTYYAYVNLENFTAWSELFGLVEEDLIFQKRILSLVSGAILPIVALGFIKSLVDYIKPDEELAENLSSKNLAEEKTNEPVSPGEVVNVEDKQEPDSIIPLSEPLNNNIPVEELLIDAGGSLHSIDDDIDLQIEKKETEHNGRVVIEERRILPISVETPSSSLNPTRL
jgi:hypothetical protein